MKHQEIPVNTKTIRYRLARLRSIPHSGPMPSRRRFLISSTLASCAVHAQERPKTESARPDPTMDSRSDIFEAAFRGDLKRATELAEQNPAIAKLRSPDGRLPLHYAAAGGHPD